MPPNLGYLTWDWVAGSRRGLLHESAVMVSSQRSGLHTEHLGRVTPTLIIVEARVTSAPRSSAGRPHALITGSKWSHNIDNDAACLPPVVEEGGSGWDSIQERDEALMQKPRWYSEVDPVQSRYDSRGHR